MNPTLRAGSRGFEVAVVQLQLNLKVSPSPDLSVDGAFGPETQSAVVAFQRGQGLNPDGIVGAATHAALAQGLSLTTADHRVTHVAQPTPTTCWAASTAMMGKTTVAAVLAKTPAAMLAGDGGLWNKSETDQAVVAGTRFGNLHGLKCHAPMSWTVAALVNTLRRGPLMFDMLWNAADYVQGQGSPGHMVVVSALVSDGNALGNGTHLLVLDPWPPNVGKVSWVEYQQWVREVPTRTYRVFERR